MLSSGGGRRETASGFYPWGKVDSPRKRVAVGLCGWRHENSFPMTQSAHSLRQIRSIPLCSKAVFLCFCFWFHSRFDNNAESIPRNFSTERWFAIGFINTCYSYNHWPMLFWAVGSLYFCSRKKEIYYEISCRIFDEYLSWCC